MHAATLKPRRDPPGPTSLRSEGGAAGARSMQCGRGKAVRARTELSCLGQNPALVFNSRLQGLTHTHTHTPRSANRTPDPPREAAHGPPGAGTGGLPLGPAILRHFLLLLVVTELELLRVVHFLVQACSSRGGGKAAVSTLGHEGRWPLWPSGGPKRGAAEPLRPPPTQAARSPCR